MLAANPLPTSNLSSACRGGLAAQGEAAGLTEEKLAELLATDD